MFGGNCLAETGVVSTACQNPGFGGSVPDGVPIPHPESRAGDLLDHPLLQACESGSHSDWH
jgi:hypothetical protein